MAQPYTSTLGRAAYIAYGKTTGGFTHDGRTMPDWDELGDTIQAAWGSAGRAALAAAALTPATPAVLPSLGDVVLVTADPEFNNGAKIAPAIVTSGWPGTTSINVRVLLNSDHPPEWRTSLAYTDDLDTVETAERPYRWTWPTPATP